MDCSMSVGHLFARRRDSYTDGQRQDPEFERNLERPVYCRAGCETFTPGSPPFPAAARRREYDRCMEWIQPGLLRRDDLSLPWSHASIGTRDRRRAPSCAPLLVREVI